MSPPLPTTRRVFRRTDTHTPSAPTVTLSTEPIPPLTPTSLLLKVHTISLNYRDANIANGGNPWPVIPHGIPCNDAAGEIIAIGDAVKGFKIGERVAPIVDTKNLTGREKERSWLAADEDGVLAEYVVFDESVAVRLPRYLSWEEACLIPCAGVTAWMGLQAVGVGKSVLIQGTGGVALFALHLARASGLKVILSSSSDEKLSRISAQFPPPLLTVNYKTNPDWHEDVLRLTDGEGVDLVMEVGGSPTLLQSMLCTRRGGIVSQVGYLGKQDPGKFDVDAFLGDLIDRRAVLRGINAGSRQDMEDLCAALDATQMPLRDIIDSVEPFERAEEAIEHIWQRRQVGKVVLRV
ncbi:chaperonin 10-like protein [Aspergillus insuetus]